MQQYLLYTKFMVITELLVNFAKIGYASGIVIAIAITTIVYLDKKIIQLFQMFNIDSIGLIISGSFILIFAYLIRFLVAFNPIEAAYQR